MVGARSERLTVGTNWLVRQSKRRLDIAWRGELRYRRARLVGKARDWGEGQQARCPPGELLGARGG